MSLLGGAQAWPANALLQRTRPVLRAKAWYLELIVSLIALNLSQ